MTGVTAVDGTIPELPKMSGEGFGEDWSQETGGLAGHHTNRGTRERK